MKCPVLIHLNDYYILLHSDRLKRKETDEKHDLNVAELDLCPGNEEWLHSLHDNQIITSSDMRKIFPESFPLKARKYRVSDQNRYYIFIPHTFRNRWPWNRGGLTNLLSESKRTVAKFFYITSDQLLQDLLGTEEEREKQTMDWPLYLRALLRFTGFDHYRLWIYNPYTERFTLFTRSIDFFTDIIPPYDPDTLLFKFMKNGKICQSDDLSKAGQKLIEAGMQSRCLIRLDLGIFDPRTIGVLSLSSRYPNFALTDIAKNYIRNFLTMRYQADRAQYQRYLTRIEDYFIKNYKIGRIKGFLYGLTQKICSALHFESCAIFLKDNEKNELVLKALYGKEHRGEPSSIETYDLGESSLTAAAFNEEKPQFSYDLPHDPRKGGTFVEDTEHEPQSWFGLPIMIEGRSPWGILCVTNKYEEFEENGQVQRQIVHFRPIDNISLEMICHSLANILAIEEKFQQTEQNLQHAGKRFQEASQALNNFQKIHRNLQDFNRVFLHEIRTPISTFNTAPLRVEKKLHRLSLPADDERPIRDKVYDIKTMGERLEFITTLYNFDELTKFEPDKCEELSVLRDVVFPVIDVTEEYLSKQYGVGINLWDESMKRQKIYGDKMRLNIAFNILINNAGKYSTLPKQPIFIKGEYNTDRRRFNIIVESHSLPICEDEKDRIFKKNQRGKNAEEQRYPGTGIGLPLSRQIMKNQGGDLILTSLSDPVIFTMKIPISKIEI